MKSPKEYSEAKKYQIKRQRQKLSIKLYVIMLILVTIGAIPTVLNNPHIGKKEGIIYLLVVFSADIIIFTVLYIGYRLENKLLLVDIFLFSVIMIIYIIAVTTSPRLKIFNIVIWMPLLIMFVYAIKRTLITIAFLLIHLGVTIYYLLTFPTYDYTINQGNYSAIISVTLILFIAMDRLVRLHNNYENTILDDYETLQSNNMELTALNEEYYASQEELMHQYDEIQYLAYHDSLTGLYNRKGFTNKLASHLSLETGGVIILIDIVRFNELNNVFGFEMGDKALKASAENIQLLTKDYIVAARMGNDVFALLTKPMDSDEAIIKLIRSLSQKVILDDIEIKLIYSYGIVPFDSESKNAEDLIKKAEITLFKAKSQDERHPYYIYDHSLQKDTEYHIRLSYALDESLINHDLHMHFQPIYQTKSKSVVGFEALARWNHEEFGFISPLTFIGIAENSMTIHYMGKYFRNYLATTIKDLDLLNLNPGLRMTINVSSKELAKLDFSDKVIHQFQTEEIPISMIGLEITESALIGNIDLALKHLTALKEAGFSIYLDDFGTGFSSLNYLDKLPIDVLKIDKTFIDQLHGNKRKQDLLLGIVKLAKVLAIKTVAEGVETEEEYNLVLDMGIDYIQGYYFSKPLPADQIPQLLKKSD